MANRLNIPSAVGTGIPPDQEPGVQAGTMEDMLAGPDLPHVIPHDAEADAAPNLVPNYLPVIFLRHIFLIIRALQKIINVFMFCHFHGNLQIH